MLSDEVFFSTFRASVLGEEGKSVLGEEGKNQDAEIKEDVGAGIADNKNN